MNPSEDPKYQHGTPPIPGQMNDGIIISPDTLRENRIPLGQSRTRKWPVLHYGTVPTVDHNRWSLQVSGLVSNPFSLSLTDFRSLPRVKVFSDFHCVTRWSRLGNLWEGVSARVIAERAGILPEASFVVLTGYDSGWTTNLPLADFLEEDVLLADLHDGEPIDADHGGPVRVVVPRLYAWKSAKWLRKIEFVAEDSPGYWEQVGYHLRGDPWVSNSHNPDGERFRDDPNWQGERREI